MQKIPGIFAGDTRIFMRRKLVTLWEMPGVCQIKLTRYPAFFSRTDTGYKEFLLRIPFFLRRKLGMFALDTRIFVDDTRNFCRGY